MRGLITSALLLCSFAANAVPVTLSSQAWEWKWDKAVNAGTPESIQIGDAYLHWNTALYNGPTYHAQSQYGTADAWAYAQLSSTQVASADLFSFDVTANMSISAIASAGLPTEAYAVAGMRLNRAIFYFDVLEDVLYTGSHALYTDSASPFFPSGPSFASGSMVGAGRYFASFVGESLFATARAGDTLLLESSSNYGYGFSRVAVPLPATLPLILVGLGAIGWARRRFTHS
jgi:PEP-CTERM motif